MLILAGVLLIAVCAVCLVSGFYFTRYAFSPKGACRFHRLCRWIFSHSFGRVLYAAFGGLAVGGIFSAACLLYMGFYRMLTGYPVVLLLPAKWMLAVLLLVIGALSALLFGRHVLLLHQSIYQSQNDD